MNVGELKKLLENLPDDMECICQKDSEGNGYSPLAGVDRTGIYVPENKWSGEVYDPSWSANDVCMSKAEWNKILKLPRALILFPIN